jgi:acyl dehydratase
MSQEKTADQALDLQALAGNRVGPYLSYNPVSRTQIWQWCSAMGDRNPLYLDDDYRGKAGFDRVVAPPAMMQMWSMRDVNMEYAPGSTAAPPYQVLDTLSQNGFPGNVAVSYDITFHRLLLEGDRAHHYTTVVAISDLKRTTLGEGYFVTERVEYLDQGEQLFAEALITYFQYKPTAIGDADTAEESAAAPAASPAETGLAENDWQTDFTDISYARLTKGQTLPELAIPITHKLIVSGAVATQDFIDVHHNAPAAKAAAMPDIFMNILTTSGLSARYLSDWAGPGSRLKTIKFKLMAPNVPGDRMVMQGRVSKLEQAAGEKWVTVEFAGRNGLVFHVTGCATLAFKS